MRTISLLILLVLVSLPNYGQKKQKPNIIIILTDDQGYDDVGFNGSKQIKTPNIDRIADNGVVFTNGYASYAVCGPSRAGLITGRYQDRFGFSRNPLFAPKDSKLGLPLTEETLAEALKKVGYTNMAIGKWHLGAHSSLRPLKRGFDEFFGFLSGGHKYFPEQLIRKDLSEVESQFDAYNTRLLRNNTRINETEYLTDAFSREAVNFVKKNHDKPFFLYLAYNAPHAPLQATEKYLNRYKHLKNKKRQTYAAMVSAVDDGVGLLLNTLNKLNIEENTIIFFLSDNGGNESKGAYNGLLKKGKGSLYEGGIRVPFAMQWPLKVPKKIRYEQPVIALDIFATVAEETRLLPKNDLDGVNLIPFLQKDSKSNMNRELYWRMYDKKSFAIRKGNEKLIRDNKGTIGLFQLNQDISEKNKIIDSLKASQLKLRFDYWNAKNKKPIFSGLYQNKTYNQKHPKRFKNVESY